MFSKDIRYILPDFHFMFIDRYEIHIQVFIDFIQPVFIIFDPHLLKNNRNEVRETTVPNAFIFELFKFSDSLI